MSQLSPTSSTGLIQRWSSCLNQRSGSKSTEATPLSQSTLRGRPLIPLTPITLLNLLLLLILVFFPHPSNGQPSHSTTETDWLNKVTDTTGATVLSHRVFTPQHPCPKPSLWLFLLGEFRTFKTTFQGHLDMLQASAPDGCWYVVVAAGPSIGDDPPKYHYAPWTGLKAPQERPDDYVSSLLDELGETAFQGRLAYILLEQARGEMREGLHRHAWRLSQKSYPYAAYAMTKIIAEKVGVKLDKAAVVMRSRPDMIFLETFKLSGLQKLFAEPPWFEHLQVGQQLDPDLNMFTSYGSWENDIARPLEFKNQGDVQMFGSANLYVRAHHMFTGFPECFCLESVGKHDQNDITCKPEHRTCHAYFFDVWETRRFCRFDHPKQCKYPDSEPAKGSVIDVTQNVRAIYAGDQCEPYTFASRKNFMHEETKVLDMSFEPARYLRASETPRPLTAFQAALNKHAHMTDLRHVSTTHTASHDSQEAANKRCTYCKDFTPGVHSWCSKDEYYPDVPPNHG